MYDRSRKTYGQNPLGWLGQNIEPFHDSSNSYVTVDGDTYRVWSSSFGDRVRHAYMAEKGEVMGTTLLREIQSGLAGAAQLGPQTKAYKRVAWDEAGNLWVDLGGDSWSMGVRVSPEGWEILDPRPVVKFYRPSGGGSMAPSLEIDPRASSAAAKGPSEVIRGVFGMQPEQCDLLTAWLIDSLWPDAPHTVLLLMGEPGSGKTTLANALKHWIDPEPGGVGSPIRDEESFALACDTSWLVAIDNITATPDWIVTQMCQSSTGGNYGKRKLYSSDERTAYRLNNPLLLNGVHGMNTRPDLLRRCLLLDLSIVPGKHRPDSQLRTCFEAARWPLLCGLFEALSCALRNRGKVKTDDTGTMAEFSARVSPAREALDWPEDWLGYVYGQSRAALARIELSQHPLAHALVNDARLLLGNRFEGSAYALSKRLGEVVPSHIQRSRDWPSSPAALTRNLRAIAPLLATVGVDIAFTREGRFNTRVIRITKRPR